jgi:hypothetical protein
MSRVRFIFLGIILAATACSRAPREEQKSTEQPPAAQQPQAPSPSAEAPATQPEAAPAASERSAPEAARKTATARPKTSHQPAGKDSHTADRSAPISRSEESQTASRSNGETHGDTVVPPTRNSGAQVSNAAPEPPRPIYAVLSSGTKLDVRLTEPLSTDDNRSGDKFEATLDKDLEANGKIIAPRGSVVVGKIVTADQGGRVEGRAAMSLTLTEIRTRATKYPVHTNTLTFDAESSKKSDATKIGAGAAIGAVIGAIAGGGKGAAIGAGVGGGAGTGAVLATRGKALKFPSEHQFTFELREDLQVKLQE